MSKQVMQRLLFGIPTGITIGLLWSLGISYYFGTTYQPSTPAFMAQFTDSLNALSCSVLLWAGMGVVFSLGSLIFEQERWSLTRQTALNFGITYVGFSGLAIVARWFPINLVWLLLYTGLFGLFYLVIWLVQYLAMRRLVAAMNRRLNQ
jgi:hypothetical protein